MNYVRYIKKNGKYLAYRNIVDESDYWEVSEINQTVSSGWYWTDDIEKARRFANTFDAEVFLVRQRGEFWQGVSLERY